MKTFLLIRVENIVSKGEIPCFEQFLLLSQCFQKLSATEAQKASICGKGLKFMNVAIFPFVSLFLNDVCKWEMF